MTQRAGSINQPSFAAVVDVSDRIFEGGCVYVVYVMQYIIILREFV